LYNLRVVDGQIRFDDRPKARVHEVRALQLGVPFLSNLDDAVEVLVQPHLAFELDGTAFDTGAQVTPFAPERAGSVAIKTGDIDLADWLPYLPSGLPLRPAAGTLALDLTLQFKAPPGAAPEVGVKGSLRAKGVRLADAGDATWAELASLSMGDRRAAAEPPRGGGGDAARGWTFVRSAMPRPASLMHAFASDPPGADMAPPAPAWRRGNSAWPV
jgi:hypothetical protein